MKTSYRVKGLLICFVFGLGVLVSCCSSAFAAGKFGCIDMGKVFNAYEKTKASDKVLEEKGKVKEEQRNKLVEEVKRLQDELELMSPKGKEEKQALIDQKTKGLRDFERDARDDLMRERDTMAREIIEEIKGVVAQFAKEQDYAFVIEQGALVYSLEQTDITAQIISTLNTKYAAKRK